LTDFTHVGYGDESHWNTGRYRSLGLVTLKASDLDETVAAAQDALDRSGVQVFAWKELRTANQAAAAKRLCAFACRLALAGTIRVDVLIWDTYDSRHQIQGRDDTANLARMYYHLVVNVVERRWPRCSTWKICPDSREDTDWKPLERSLQYPSRNMKASTRLLPDQCSQPHASARLRVTPGNPQKQPLIQIADLFAGMAVFSWSEHAKYENWKTRESGQQSMFGEASELKFSSSQAYKARVLQCFDVEHLIRLHGVTHCRGEGLRTRDPSAPINFWMYVPQHEDDKAPRRGE